MAKVKIEEKTGFFGGKYLEDSQGRQSEVQTGFFGGKYVEQDEYFGTGYDDDDDDDYSSTSYYSGSCRNYGDGGWLYYTLGAGCFIAAAPVALELAAAVVLAPVALRVYRYILPFNRPRSEMHIGYAELVARTASKTDLRRYVGKDLNKAELRQAALSKLKEAYFEEDEKDIRSHIEDYFPSVGPKTVPGFKHLRNWHTPACKLTY